MHKINFLQTVLGFGVGFGVVVVVGVWLAGGNSEGRVLVWSEEETWARENNQKVLNGEYEVMKPLAVEDSLRYQVEPAVEEYDVYLQVVGDIAPVRMAAIQLYRYGMNYAFENVREVLGKADVLLGNLETPLLEGCPLRDYTMKFCGNPRFASALGKAGFGIVSLANNHSYNYGQSGYEETVGYLERAGLKVAEKDKGVVYELGRKKIGVVVFNDVGESVDYEGLMSEISETKDEVDILVVMPHWGREYTYVPVVDSGKSREPTELARQMIDAGADLIVGAHPHWVQSVEIYKGKVIAYSHGNFVFDQEWSQETKEGVIGHYFFRGDDVVEVFFTPVIIEDWVRPRLASEEEALRVLEKMRSVSR
jgi:poly-gamma-glutamate capsule biosynthesis protein CapA/YwtB (metallophosphatase superfamily)